ncbi:hypothetical protein [Brevibacterium metallidurans]|uniref:hypothetical protein n=1 Tax=Brevibacterium metallidurans TaxID=1482676 RepID=UPI0030DA9C19
MTWPSVIASARRTEAIETATTKTRSKKSSSVEAERPGSLGSRGRMGTSRERVRGVGVAVMATIITPSADSRIEMR